MHSLSSCCLLRQCDCRLSQTPALQGLVGQWSNAEAEMAALQGEAVLRIATGIQQFEDKLQQ